MSSWFIILNIIILLSSPSIQTRSRRRHSMSSNPFSSAAFAYNADSLTESASPKNRANEQQIEQFERLVYERLDLKERPNVDGTGIPSIVKQLEQQHIHEQKAMNSYSSEKLPDDTQPTTERAIFPGDAISHHTCQRQLTAKLNLNKENLHHIDCFRFTKSALDSNLPTNQIIQQLRIYVKKNYFHFHNIQLNMLTPEMFQIYQVFRPTSNETFHNRLSGLTNTLRLSINQVKQLNDHWLEFIIEPNDGQISIEQIYKQFITPWYGLAINRELQLSRSRFYRRYHSKKHPEDLLRSETNNGSQQQLIYMLVEYGDKFSTSGRRDTRAVKSRPAKVCDGKSPCCRRSLFIDLNQGNNALDFVIYPRQIDIGECVGLCGPSGSSLQHTKVKNEQQQNGQHSSYEFIRLHQNGISFDKSTSTTQINKADEQSTHCCSFSRTGGLEIIYTTGNDGPIIRKFIPNIIVEDCKCGLPATI